MQQFIQQLINGIALGGLYALTAIGYSLVYGVMELVNFSHGAVYMLGAYIFYILFEICGAPLWLSVPGALIAAGIMGHIAIQVILNIAVVTNSIPNTGITLPFISYGGTSVVFLLGEMGLALSVSANQGFSRRSVTKT